MPLTALRAKLPIRPPRQKVCIRTSLYRPEQLNSLADQLASKDLRATDKLTEFYPLLPACRTYLRDGAGYITSLGKSTLTNEYEIRAYTQKRNNWTDHIYYLLYDSIN
jgi:hypothetical protein